MTSSKSGLSTVFFAFFGAHRLYLGRNVSGSIIFTLFIISLLSAGAINGLSPEAHAESHSSGLNFLLNLVIFVDLLYIFFERFQDSEGNIVKFRKDEQVSNFGLLGICTRLGFFGVHDFYLGKKMTGAAKVGLIILPSLLYGGNLLGSQFIALALVICFFWWMIDICLIAFERFKDADGNIVKWTGGEGGLNSSSSDISDKSSITAISIVLFGLHRIYVGRYLSGIAQLLMYWAPLLVVCSMMSVLQSSPEDVAAGSPMIVYFWPVCCVIGVLWIALDLALICLERFKDGEGRVLIWRRDGKKSTFSLVYMMPIFGIFGAHRFYTGKYKTGALQALLTVVSIPASIFLNQVYISGFVIAVVWVIVDYVYAVSGNFTDENGEAITWHPNLT